MIPFQRSRLLNSRKFWLALLYLPLNQAFATYRPWEHSFADLKVTADLPQQLYDIELYVPIISTAATGRWIPFLQAQMRLLAQETNAIQVQTRRLFTSGGIGIKHHFLPELAWGAHLFLDYDVTLNALRPSLGASIASAYGSIAFNYYLSSHTEAIDSQTEVARVLSNGWDLHLQVQTQRFPWVSAAVEHSYYEGQLTPYELDAYISKPKEQKSAKRKNHMTQLGISIQPIPFLAISPSYLIGSLDSSSFAISANLRYRLGVPLQEQFSPSAVRTTCGFKQTLLSIVPRAKTAPLAYTINPSKGVPDPSTSMAESDRTLYNALNALIEHPKIVEALQKRKLKLSDYLERRGPAILIKQPFNEPAWHSVYNAISIITHPDKTGGEKEEESNAAFRNLSILNTLSGSLNSSSEEGQVVDLKKLDQTLNQSRILEQSYIRVLPDASYLVSPHNVTHLSSPHYQRIHLNQAEEIKQKNEHAKEERLHTQHYMKLKACLNQVHQDTKKTDDTLEPIHRLLFSSAPQGEHAQFRKRFFKDLGELFPIRDQLTKKDWQDIVRQLQVIAKEIVERSDNSTLSKAFLELENTLNLKAKQN